MPPRPSHAWVPFTVRTKDDVCRFPFLLVRPAMDRDEGGKKKWPTAYYRDYRTLRRSIGDPVPGGPSGGNVARNSRGAANATAGGAPP
eukprot:gene8117-2381_t